MERLTIDEAIQRENKIAEENQKIVDTEIVFDDVSLSQLYCDDTEVIEEHLSNYKKCAEYHKQIADWLEELKDHRERECNHINEALYDKGYSDGYNKAIDDFYIRFICEVKNRYIGIPIVDIVRNKWEQKNSQYIECEEIALKIAEQLKVGEENEKERNAFYNAKQIVQEVAEEYKGDMKHNLAEMYAKNMVDYGVDVTKEWQTATQQSCALEKAFIRGIQYERDRFIELRKEYNNGWIACSGCKYCKNKECEHYGKV